MKNRILVFLVFITTFLKGQSVDPETFPTVIGEIGNKNLYTNTGGEGKFTAQRLIDSVKITDTVSMTYAQFYNTITNNNLQVGKTYILVDFQTVYDQPDFDINGVMKPVLVTKTASTIEEIWVLALSNNQIADRAYSKTFPNDEIKYDWTYNSTEVNGSLAMGRISERIDDKGNRTDYDHRTILFKRYDDGTGEFNQWKDNGNASQELLTFSASCNNVKIGDYAKFSAFAASPIKLSNNVITGLAIDCKIDDFSSNNTFTISNLFSYRLGTNNSNILIKGSGVLLKSSMGNQNKDIVIIDGEHIIESNNINIVLNSNNNDYNIHQIGNQCSNIVVGQFGCIQINNNSNNINILDNGKLITSFATNINIGINSFIYGKGFLDNITLGDNGDILFDFDLRNVIVGNNSDKLRLFGTCENITLGDNCNKIYLSNCNTINLATDTRGQVIEYSGNITIASNIGASYGCNINFSGNLIIGTDNESLYFNNVKPNNGANFMTIGNDNKNCTFYGEFVQFTDGGVNDLNNMQMCNFNFMDDTGWVNGINPTNTPEVYTGNSEKTIFKGNGNFYEKHFNGTNEIYTILN